MLGHTGHRSANDAVRQADCLLVLGARLDVRQTGTMTEEWAQGKTVIRVDVDAGEMRHSRVRVDIPIQCHVEAFLLWLNRTS
jgi:acetolactate synthase-1/2/3 large subunit